MVSPLDYRYYMGGGQPVSPFSDQTNPLMGPDAPTSEQGMVDAALNDPSGKTAYALTHSSSTMQSLIMSDVPEARAKKAQIEALAKKYAQDNPEVAAQDAAGPTPTTATTGAVDSAPSPSPASASGTSFSNASSLASALSVAAGSSLIDAEAMMNAYNNFEKTIGFGGSSSQPMNDKIPAQPVSDPISTIIPPGMVATPGGIMNPVNSVTPTPIPSGIVEYGGTNSASIPVSLPVVTLPKTNPSDTTSSTANDPGSTHTWTQTGPDGNIYQAR